MIAIHEGRWDNSNDERDQRTWAILMPTGVTALTPHLQRWTASARMPTGPSHNWKGEVQEGRKKERRRERAREGFEERKWRRRHEA